LWHVKNNQPKLKQKILGLATPMMLAWKDGSVPPKGAGCDHAEEHFKGHGRIERRMLLALPVKASEVNWPQAKQVVLLRRERQQGTKPMVEEYHCGITSCSPQQASASQLLEAIRGHWGIENRLFHVRDVTLGEDACRVRTGDAPQVMAALRNTIISMLNQAGKKNKAAALRRYAAHYEEALAIVTAGDG